MNQFFDDEDDGKDIETETRPGSAVENSDNSLPSSGEGDVDDEEEYTSYVPIRFEVVQLVKYWFGGILDNDFFFFICGRTDFKLTWRDIFASKRINYARTVIGEDAVDQAIEEVREKFKEEVNPQMWDIYENGSDEQWREVWAETWRDISEWDCAGDLKQMDDLESKYPSDLIALVLHDWGAGRRSTVLVFSTDSELVPLLEKSLEFEVLTTKSRIRAVTANRDLRHRGFIRARRQDGDWLFDFPCATSGTLAHGFLDSVRNQIKKVLSDAREEDPLA